jgi:hypothetical protein
VVRDAAEQQLRIVVLYVSLYVLYSYVYVDMIEEHSSLHTNMNNKEHSPVCVCGQANIVVS